MVLQIFDAPDEKGDKFEVVDRRHAVAVVGHDTRYNILDLLGNDAIPYSLCSNEPVFLRVDLVYYVQTLSRVQIVYVLLEIRI